jgi:hypothetical protein
MKTSNTTPRSGGFTSTVYGITVMGRLIKALRSPKASVIPGVYENKLDAERDAAHWTLRFNKPTKVVEVEIEYKWKVK